MSPLFSFDYFFCLLFLFTSWFFPWEIRVAFPKESQLQQSHVTQPAVHDECFSVSIIHWNLAWTTGSLTCVQMLMHAVAHGGLRTHVRESALTNDSGRKILCCTGESNLPQRRAAPTLYQLSYTSTPKHQFQHKKWPFLCPITVYHRTRTAWKFHAWLFSVVF